MLSLSLRFFSSQPLTHPWNIKWVFLAGYMEVTYLKPPLRRPEQWEERTASIRGQGPGLREKCQTYPFQVGLRTSCFFVLCSEEFSSVQSLSLWLKSIAFSCNPRAFLVIRGKKALGGHECDSIVRSVLMPGTWKILNSKPHTLTWPYSIMALPRLAS